MKPSSTCAETSVNFIQSHPEIPVRAKETMMAVQRADAVINRTQLLMAEGQRRNLHLRAEATELKPTEETLNEARVKGHAFNLDSTRKRADKSYFKGAKVKEALRKRLGVE